MDNENVEKTALEQKLEAALDAVPELDEGTAEEESALDGEAPPAATVLEAEPVPADGLAAITKERDELQDKLLRFRAEFDNYRKRTARETTKIRQRAAEGLVRDLLPVLDNLERALDHVEDRSHGLAQGVDLVCTQFQDALRGQGVEAIPALGEPFDPNVHEALSHMPSQEHVADVVVQECERGYRMGDFIVRPAKVIVSSGAQAQEGAAEDEDVAAPETLETQTATADTENTSSK